MKKRLCKGKFIVFEGLDGSGKSTQANLLIKKLKKDRYKVEKIDFPQYGKKSAGLIEEYLAGKYGSSKKVGPWRASVFYACDRYDASFKIRQWLREGKVVVANRYLASNVGHQGGKIKNKKEREKYIQWLYHLEYQLFGIPKPDITFFLKTSPGLSKKLAPQNIDRKKKTYLGSKVRDIHERDILHLKSAFNSYLELARSFPREFKMIECLEKGKLLPPEKIHQKILKVVKH